MYLHQLKEASQAGMRHAITDAVISVPVCFGDEGRRALCRAAQVASFKRIRLISDPAAIGLYLDRAHKRGLFLLVDIGATYVNAAYLLVRSQSVILKACHGWVNMGGGLMDSHIIKAVLSRWGITEDDVTLSEMQLLEETTRVVKEALGTYHSATFPSISPARFTDLTIDRAFVQEAVQDAVARLLEHVEHFTSERPSSVETADVTVLLAGGAAQTPGVYDAFAALYGAANVEMIDRPDAVAVGCAMYARQLWASKPRDYQLVDLMMRPLYTFCKGVRRCVIPSCSPYPIKFTESALKGESIEIHEGSQSEGTRLIGTVSCPLRTKVTTVASPVVLCRNENGEYERNAV